MFMLMSLDLLFVFRLLTAISRPISTNAEWETPAPPDLPFDYDAKPSTFYFDVESIGNIEPDAVVQQGITVLQRKLAGVLSSLTGASDEDGDMNGADRRNGADGGPDGAGGRSPDAYEPPEGMDTGGFTSYGAGAGPGTGGQSAWGGAGGATPYGATPYGQSGGYGF